MLSGLLTRAAGEHVAGSPYAIRQGSLAANGDYTISFTGNTLDITTATLTVTANHQTKVYGQADPALTYVASGFQFSDTEASVLSGLLTRAAGEHVGQPLRDLAGQAGGNSDYTISFTGNTLDITTATLTVTANHQTKVYGPGRPRPHVCRHRLRVQRHRRRPHDRADLLDLGRRDDRGGQLPHQLRRRRGRQLQLRLRQRPADHQQGRQLGRDHLEDATATNRPPARARGTPEPARATFDSPRTRGGSYPRRRRRAQPLAIAPVPSARPPLGRDHLEQLDLQRLGERCGRGRGHGPSRR